MTSGKPPEFSDSVRQAFLSSLVEDYAALYGEAGAGVVRGEGGD